MFTETPIRQGFLSTCVSACIFDCPPKYGRIHRSDMGRDRVRREAAWANTSERLSALRVSNLDRPGYYADGANLYFRVAPAKPLSGAATERTGARGWIFRFARGGRTRDMGLGAYPQISLATARRL